MPAAKMREILGEPIDERPPLPVFGPNERSPAVLEYGRISFESSAMPGELNFTLMTLEGKVYSKEFINAPLAKSVETFRASADDA